MPSDPPEAQPASEPVSSLYDTRPPQYSLWRRMQIPFISSAAIAVIRALGPTLRFRPWELITTSNLARAASP